MAGCIRFAAASFVWLWAASAMAAADPLTVIPDNALGLAVVNNLSDTSARVQKLTEKMQLPVPELLPMAQLYTGAQEGVDAAGTLAAAVMPDEREDVTWTEMVVVFVPVTDYKAFVAQLQPDDPDAKISEVTIFGSPFLVTHKGEFAVVAASSQKALLEKIQSSSKSVAEVVAPIRPWLDKQQVAVVLTPTGRKMLFDTVNGLLETGVEALKQPEAGDQNPDEKDDKDDADDKDDDEDDADKKDDADDADEKDDAPQPAADPFAQFRELAGAFKELLAAADGQLTQMGVGLRIDDTTALHLSARMLFVPEGPLATWADTVKPPKEGLLAGLPPDKFMLAYGGVAPEFHPTVTKIIDRITESGLAQMGLSEASRKQYAETLARHRENVVGHGTLLGQLRPGDALMATSMSLEHVKDADKHLKLTRELFEALADARLKGDQDSKPLYSINDVTVGDLKALEVVTDMSAAIGAAGQGAGGAGGATEHVQGLFSRLFGNDGQMRAYVTVANEHTVVMAYSKELLTRGVAHIREGKPGLEADAAIAKTASLLPAEPQWAAYVNPQGLVQWVDMLLKNLPAEMNIKIPPFPPSDPIGMAAQVSASGLDAELVLPDSVVAGIGNYVGTIQQMMQGGAPLP